MIKMADDALLATLSAQVRDASCKDVGAALLEMTEAADARGRKLLCEILDHPSVRSDMSLAARNGHTLWAVPPELFPGASHGYHVNPFLYKGLYVWRRVDGVRSVYTVCWDGTTPGGYVLPECLGGD